MNHRVDNIFADIETMPSQRPDIIDELQAAVDSELTAKLVEIKAPSNYKDETKIAEYIATKSSEINAEFADEFERRHHATGLDGAFGEVYCIGVAINNGEPVVFSRGTEWAVRETEAQVLTRFFDFVYSNTGSLTRVVGHNIAGFDIRFLHQRCMVNGVRPPSWFPLDPKPWGDEVFDTMVRWAGARDRVKLSKLCRAFGIEHHDDIDGSDVWAHIKSGQTAKVDEHCRVDIVKTRDVFKRMTYVGMGLK